MMLKLRIISWDDNSKVYFEGTFDECIGWMRANKCIPAYARKDLDEKTREILDEHDVRFYGDEKVYRV